MLPRYLDLDSRPWEAYTDGRWPVVTLDFETTNLDNGDPRNVENRIVQVCLRVNGGPLLTEAEAWKVLGTASGVSLILVAHNAKFELGWLNRAGIDTTHWLPFDTMIAEYVIAGNRRVDLDLDSVAKRYGLGAKGRAVDRMMKAGVCPSEMPEHLLRERVTWDVDRTYKLYRKQLEVLAQLGLVNVAFTRCIFTPVLARTEPVGLRLDRARVIAEYERLLKRRAELQTELTTLAGGKKLKGPQLAELLFDDLGFSELTRRGKPLRTKTGRRLTDAKTMDKLEAVTEDQRRFVQLRGEYGKVDAAITKTVEFFYMVCEEQGGEFVANFNQCRVATHRLSSSGKPVVFKDGKRRSTQFQNLPRAYKPLFEAPEGYVYAEADGTQLEWRCAGSLARDPQILADVENGHDVHKFTASVLKRIPMDDVTKGDRQDAKANTFKPLYGGQRGSKREMAYYEAFRERYKVTNQMQQGWALEVLRTGQLRTATGLIFYWPGTKMMEDGYITNTPSIYDYPVQSIATAEIIPVSVVYTYWECRARGIDATLANTVHDSTVARVAEKDLDKYWEVVVECFLDKTYEYMDKVYGISLYVPLGVSYKAGKHWGEGGEEVTVSRPYGAKESTK
jgi:DNA polymerase I-like protein with 3'-5' exonuclease and polymerase domains